MTHYSQKHCSAFKGLQLSIYELCHMYTESLHCCVIQFSATAIYTAFWKREELHTSPTRHHRLCFQKDFL